MSGVTLEGLEAKEGTEDKSHSLRIISDDSKHACLNSNDHQNRSITEGPVCSGVLKRTTNASLDQDTEDNEFEDTKASALFLKKIPRKYEPKLVPPCDSVRANCVDVGGMTRLNVNTGKVQEPQPGLQGAKQYESDQELDYCDDDDDYVYEDGDSAEEDEYEKQAGTELTTSRSNSFCGKLERGHLSPEKAARFKSYPTCGFTSFVSLNEEKRRRGTVPAVVRVLCKFHSQVSFETLKIESLTKYFPKVGKEVFESAQPPHPEDNLDGSMIWILKERIKFEKQRLNSIGPQSEHTDDESKVLHLATGEGSDLQVLGNFLSIAIVDVATHCMLCWNRLPLTTYRPSVCARDKCLFQSEELKLGVNIEYEVLENSTVVDFLLVLFCTALFPSGQRGINLCMPKGIGLPDNITKIQDAMREMPSIIKLREMTSHKILRKTLDSINQYLYPLLGWIVGSSNRSFFRRLPPDEEIPGLNTVCQFEVICSEEKESRFASLQREYGSFLAFHGSPSANWHSIIRLGLRNFSGDPIYRRHGNALGNGIYLAESMETTSRYMKHSGLQWEGSSIIKPSSSISCQAVCEVINNPSAFSFSDHSEGHPRMTALPNEVQTIETTTASTEVSSHASSLSKYNSRGRGIHVVPIEDYVKTSVILIYDGDGLRTRSFDHAKSLRLPKSIFPFDNHHQQQQQ
eukprot:CAMPEP_0171555144 /NCGR_PEP_ID=MMETSP0960-20121227/9957_1 /TAXON_ID=87120 /ORGANISM="Aurantiochytrium limacinum, Strain ATCCMYA-1381" /LENGTH=685 /DNA_ID=CAMNT_0012105159 /DNA_START=116 /DNA_END=2174 /DNA_ORIENTATION=-